MPTQPNVPIPQDAWVLVCDGEKAMFLRNAGTAFQPRLTVERVKKQDNPPDRYQASDRPGRMSDGPGPHSSGVDNTNWHQLNKERFAEEVAGMLDTVAERNPYGKFIVVAPPPVLGVLRTHYSTSVGRRVVTEIAKTLTKHPISDMASVIMQS